jgi:alkylation response protein AidB-like acyl-CoA dehydrogenase
MDIRLREFKPIQIQKYVPELDLLSSPLLNSNEKEFLAKFYDFLENELDEDLRTLEKLNYLVEEPTQDKKRELVVKIMKKLAEKGYYSTVLNTENYTIGRIMRNVLIAYALCGGRWSDSSESYIAGNWSVEMGRLAGGTLYCNPVSYKANEYQREKFLIPVARDGAIAASGMTEFNAGSDIARMELNLQTQGDKVIAKGKKVFITNGIICEYLILYGRINRGPIGAIIVDTENQQLQNFKASRVRTYGMNDAFVSRLIFDKVEIPKENILQGSGMDIMFHQLTEERLVISAEALGDAMKKLIYSHAYALQRRQFERRLHQYQVIRFPISKNIRELNLLIAALTNYAREIDKHPELGSSKLMAQQTMGLKVTATELAFESAVHCFRTMGGRGFIRQYSVPIGLFDPYCMIFGWDLPTKLKTWRGIKLCIRGQRIPSVIQVQASI